MTTLDMEAGDNAIQVNTDSGVINVGTILTVTEIRQIALDVAKTVFLDSLPQILIVTKGDSPADSDVETVFEWEPCKLSNYNARIERGGVDGLSATPAWKWFVGDDESPPF